MSATRKSASSILDNTSSDMKCPGISKDFQDVTVVSVDIFTFETAASIVCPISGGLPA
ncbi:MAG: hypothetical protein HRT51_06775 [Colwellia sp.]|nr:hypothetical protein [Colwellia sp.]